MQGSYFSSRINVERTGEQYYLGQYNSQKRRMMSNRTDTQVEVQMINKCRVIIIRRMLYIREENPHDQGIESWRAKVRKREEKEREVL